MKILVVEDNHEKLRRVVTAICEVPGCTIDDIDTAHDAIEAKGHLRRLSYDLLILDVALPERADKMASPEGGISLLQEVLDRDIYNKPREVIGLTAFAEVLDSAAPCFAEDLWQVIYYDPASTSWSDLLKRKVRYILLAKRAGRTFEFDVDLCVITANHDPELLAVMNLPWNWTEYEVPGDGTPYWRGSYQRQGSRKSAVAANSARMGMPSSAVLAAKMISYFRPRYLSMVGITAGVRKSCEIGDVIAADPCWDYGSGKWESIFGKNVFAPAPHQFGLNSYIRGKLAGMAANALIWDKIRHEWHAPKPNTAIQLRIGPAASGAAVLATSKQAASVQNQHRKLLGIDMEAYSIFAAADDAPLLQPKAIVLKSVCDFADEEKSDDFQAYAAYTSAAALKVLVEEYL